MKSYVFEITLTEHQLNTMHFTVDSMIQGGCSAAECFEYQSPEVFLELITKLFGQVRDDYLQILAEGREEDSLLEPEL